MVGWKTFGKTKVDHIIEEPGSFSGSINSPYPALGPDPRNLISFDIFIKATAQVFKEAEKLTIES